MISVLRIMTALPVHTQFLGLAACLARSVFGALDLSNLASRACYRCPASFGLLAGLLNILGGDILQHDWTAKDARLFKTNRLSDNNVRTQILNSVHEPDVSRQKNSIKFTIEANSCFESGAGGRDSKVATVPPGPRP